MNATAPTRVTQPEPHSTPTPVASPAGWRHALLWSSIAIASLYFAFTSATYAPFLSVSYLFALVQLAQADSWRKAFYPGLAAGFTAGALRLGFFWTIFGWGALALWLVYAFWIALFVALARMGLKLRRRDLFGLSSTLFSNAEVESNLPGAQFGRWLIPFVWCGIEYFRSELYYLRFSWLSPGFAFGVNPSLVPLHWFGSYGMGLVIAAFACFGALLWRFSKTYSILALLSGMLLLRTFGWLDRNYSHGPLAFDSVRVAGIQMEFPTETEALSRLNDLIKAVPDAELLVLSEYTFMDVVPARIRNWCRQHRRYLVVGGKAPAPGNDYYDTAFVISPTGEIAFQQGKAVPIQFFKDGLPAHEQKLWDSPWGKIGICVCYDLSYSRVTDHLVRLGAQALVVPTMDLVDWGEQQHQMHARVAPVRAAEYGLAVFRVASSGISQLVDCQGTLLAQAPCPGDGATVSGSLQMLAHGRLPLDRWIAPFAAALTATLVGALTLNQIRRKYSPRPVT